MSDNQANKTNRLSEFEINMKGASMFRHVSIIQFCKNKAKITAHSLIFAGYLVSGLLDVFSDGEKEGGRKRQ